jgi:Xaa-Pro aminopeptidase
MSSTRRDRLRAQLDVLEVDAFLVTAPTNVFYLTGLESSNAAVVLTRDRTYVATDYRYLTAAHALEGVEVLEAQRDVFGWIGPRLRELGGLHVAFEADHVNVASYEALSTPSVQLKATISVVAEIRAVKEPAELEAVRHAAAIVSGAYEALAGHGFIGKTEKELVWFLERTMREAGADAASFDAIVGAGANGAIPHHHPTDRRIEPNQLVVVDAGARVDGYCSDCTRTFATGDLPDELARAYEVTKDAQARALRAIRAGVQGSKVHDLAAQVIHEGGFGGLQHGLGHGVGLDIHELPVMREGVDSTLRRSSVVTVEPGIYLAGLGGVRIEDLVIVTGDGVEILTSYTKELVTVSN